MMAAGRAAILLAAFTIVLYAQGLDRTPVYVTQDEVFFGVNAHSIANSGRDANGVFLPLYFRWPEEVSDNIWFQPVIVYVTALALKVLPFSQTSVRFPTVLIGAANVVLTYLIARKVFKKESLALIAGALLILTPAHFIHSRVAMDYLYPVPFMLAWLFCLSQYVDGRQWKWLFAGTLALGVGFYSYIAAVAMMPLYLALTLVLLGIWRAPLRHHVAALSGFAVPLLLAVTWVLQHPQALERMAKRYELVNAAAPGAGAMWQSIGQSLHFFAVTDRVSLYWSFFSPSYLFLTGAVTVVNSTRYAGVFLLALVILLPVGINRLLNGPRHALSPLLLAGFATAPLAACLVMEAYTIQRELILLPFGVLIAVAGVEAMTSASRSIWRIACILLLVLSTIQFALFRADYFGDYTSRSGGWFAGNVRAAFDEIAKQGSVTPAIYLSTSIPFAEWYWRFYVLQHGRQELLGRSVYFRVGDHVPAVQPGSLVLVRGEEIGAATAAIGEMRTVYAASTPPALSLLERP